MNEADAFGALLGKTRTAASGIEAAPLAPGPVPPPEPAPTLPAPPAFRFWLLVGLGVTLNAGWITLATWLLGHAFENAWLDPAMNAGTIDLIANLLVFSGMLAVSLVFMRLMPIAKSPPLLRSAPAFAIGLALGIGGMTIALLQSWIGNHAVSATQSAGIAPLALLIASLVTLFAAAVEEIAFRGWLQQRLAPRVGGAGAATIAAIAFSALHLSGGTRSGLALANIFLAGLFFGLLMLRTGNLWCSIGAHFAWNWSEAELFGLDPNPGAPPHGSIFDMDLVGAAIWGGSTEGMNVALPVTIALTALMLPLLAMRNSPAATTAATT